LEDERERERDREVTGDYKTVVVVEWNELDIFGFETREALDQEV
jgi:hypothetical protein